jgi:hypothetical protein
MAEVTVLSLQLALQILLPWWIVRRDMHRLPAPNLRNTWNDASFWSAVVVFGLFCIPVHFIKARRSLLGLGLGVLWLAIAIIVLAMASTLLSLIFLVNTG